MEALPAGATVPLPDGPWLLSVAGSVDVSALVLGEDGNVAGDADLVFYNAPAAPGVRLRARTVEIDAGSLRRGAVRVVVVASPEHEGGSLGRPSLTVQAVAGPVLARFVPTALTTETVVQLAEVYRHRGGWKLRALGAGYDDGLAGLVRDFGVQVDDEQPAHPAPGAARLVDEVVTLTNRERTSLGLAALTAEQRLTAAAQAHNDDMVARGFFAHESPDGASVADRVRRQGYPYRLVAENIAAGQRTAAEVVQGWLDSPGHRRNLLHPDAREIGVGYTEGGSYGTTWTQVFGRRS